MKITKSKRSFDIQFRKDKFHPHLWIENCIDEIRALDESFHLGFEFVFNNDLGCHFIALWLVCFRIEFDF